MSYMIPKAERGSGIVGSPEQKDIWQAMLSFVENLVCVALAGTGKTTTLVEGSKKLMNIRAAFLAFNKSIKEELRKRLPYGVTAATLHGFGLGILKGNLGAFEVDPDGAKLNATLAKVGPMFDLGDYWPRGLKPTVKHLIGLAKGYGVVLPHNYPGFGGYVEDLSLVDQLDFIWDHHGLGCNYPRDDIYSIVLECLHAARHNITQVDFDDMVWLPLQLELKPVTQYGFLMVDEAQDLNDTQKKVCSMSAERFCYIGDPNQSIYGFRGADSESMPNIIKHLIDTPRGVSTLPLTISRRCPKTVVDLARRIVPDFKAMPDAKQGAVIESDFDPIDLSQPGDMVLCRTNAPLVQLVYRFWAKKRKAYIQGRDMAKGIVSLLSALEASSPDDLVKKLKRYEDREITRLSGRDNDPARERKIQAMLDRVQCLGEIASKVESINDVQSHIDEIFSDATDNEKVRLSSIHKAKGLEADRVSILQPHLLPHPSAKSAWEIRQEYNLAYVAATRSKDTLNFLGEISPAFQFPLTPARLEVTDVSPQATTIPEPDQESRPVSIGEVARKPKGSVRKKSSRAGTSRRARGA